MGYKEVIARENILMPARVHARTYEISHSVPSPRSYFLYPANSNLSCFIETNPAPSLPRSFFPFKGNVLEPAPGFNKKMVWRNRN